jgi:hypothetical protein
MEQLILEIEEYCRARQIAPQKLLRASIKATWGLWQKWTDGDASPTMKVADRIRAYMAANPPASDQKSPSTPTEEDAA